MKNIEKFYENTKNALPHKNVKKFLELENKAGKAIELGCGAGRDTICLIKNGWNVSAIDREDTKEIISDQLNAEELKRFRFINQTFEKIQLEENNLVVANFSLPFCLKEYFREFWNKIVQSIQKDGYFVGNFFGPNDSWAFTREEMVFLSKEQVIALLEPFEILKFKEIETDGKTGLEKMKHWHIFEIIAKKR